MYCKTCGNKIEEDANFCIKCGNKIGEAYEEIEVSDYFNKDINPSIGIGSNKEWSKIEDALCLVSDRYSFSPCMYSHPSVKDNRVTKDKLMFYGFYANVAIKKLQKIPKSINKLIFGSIDNEIDFINLWHAFKDCGINWDDITQEKTQEILIYCTSNHYKNKITKFLLTNKPRLIVMVCKIGTYEKFKNIKLPEGEKAGIFIRSISPIFLWVPDVMNEYLKK